MTYILVIWHHENPDDPVALYSELDDERFEVRKVECFRDGRRCFADAAGHSGKTRLGVVPVPPLHEIASDRQFTAQEITKEAFAQQFVAATHPGR